MIHSPRMDAAPSAGATPLAAFPGRRHALPSTFLLSTGRATMARVSAGWTSYAPLPREVPASTGDEPRPELADIGRLARRALRGVVGAARAGEGATLYGLLREHLGDDSAESAVVEEL